MNMIKRSNTRNTIGAVSNLMFQSIEIILGTVGGKTLFQNLTQLDGATVVSMFIISPKVAAYSAQTYNSTIPTLADYQAMFFTFMKGDIQVIENLPALALNPFSDSDTNVATSFDSNLFWESLYSPQEIDFNKSYVWMAAAPSTPGLRVSLGVSYFYANN